MAEDLHDVKDIFGFSVFCCGFPVAEGVEMDFAYAVVLEFECYSVSLVAEGPGEVSLAASERFFVISG